MKGGNSIRQKLINLMYIVLIALTIFNLPVEFIESFTDLNRSLERSNDRMDQRNASTLATIERFTALDSMKYAGIYRKITLAKEISEAAIQYIDTLKRDLIAEGKGYEDGHLKMALDFSLATQKFIHQGEAEDLKKVIVTTKERLLEILDDEEQAMLDTVLDTREFLPRVKGRGVAPWVKYYFDNIPLTTAVAMLTKFQNDLRIAETIVISKYYDQAETGTGYNASFIATDTILLDTILLEKGVKKFDVFDIGEDGVARITLPQIPSDALGEAMVYTYDDNGVLRDSFKFTNGVSEVTIPTDQIGEFKIKGVVKFRYPKGDEADEQPDVEQIDEPEVVQEFPFEIPYQVINPKPFLSQGDYNILYTGINNPLNVFHPEYDRGDYRVSISQGKILDNTQDYYARVFRTGFATVVLEVPDGEGSYKKVAEEKFKVKELPKPDVKLYNKEGGEIAAKIFKSQNGLSTDLKGLAIEADFKVMDYKVTYINGKGLGIFKEKVKGSYFTGKSRELIDLAEPGDIYIFEDIQVKGPDGKNKQIDALVFNII